MCELEGASKKRGFGYDVKYQWNNWVIVQLLQEYPTAFKAGYKSDPDSPNFIEAMNGEHDVEYWEAMGIEM